MNRDVKLILDKQLNGALQKALGELNYDIIHSGGQIPENTPDMKFIIIATEMSRTILTQDPQFEEADNVDEEKVLEEELGGELPEHPGIIKVPDDDDFGSYAELAQTISTIIEQYGAEGLRGEVVYASNWM